MSTVDTTRKYDTVAQSDCVGVHYGQAWTSRLDTNLVTLYENYDDLPFKRPAITPQKQKSRQLWSIVA